VGWRHRTYTKYSLEKANPPYKGLILTPQVVFVGQVIVLEEYGVKKYGK
jgi:hypothetical protein